MTIFSVVSNASFTLLVGSFSFFAAVKQMR